MPQLLQELVEETTKSNRWAAERLGAEARQFEERPETEAAIEGLRQAAISYVTVATEFAVGLVSRHEGHWRAGLAILKSESQENALKLLQILLSSFETSLKLVQTTIRERPKIAAALNVEPPWPERLEELDRAEERLLKLASEAKKAIEHRTNPRKPADPERLAKGFQLAGEGKIISSDEARARYGPPKN